MIQGVSQDGDQCPKQVFSLHERAAAAFIHHRAFVRVSSSPPIRSFCFAICCNCVLARAYIFLIYIDMDIGGHTHIHLHIHNIHLRIQMHIHIHIYIQVYIYIYIYTSRLIRQKIDETQIWPNLTSVHI